MPRVGLYDVEDAPREDTPWGALHRGVDLSRDQHIDAYQVPNARYGVFARTRVRQVVTIIDLCETADSWWLITEHLAGPRLELDQPPARAQVILDEVLRGLRHLHDVGLAHGRLSPERVRIADDRVVLVEMMLDGDPREDVRAFARFARALAPDDRALAALLAPCLGDDPPVLDDVRLSLLAGGEAPEPRAPFAAGPTEAELLDAIRAAPEDVDLRMVYSDWLLDRGDLARARYVRRPLDAAGTPMWRAVLSASPVTRCKRYPFACPMRWVELTPTDDDRARACRECGSTVYYCTTAEELRARTLRGDPVVVDEEIT